MRFSHLKIGAAFRFTARGNSLAWRKVTQRGAVPLGVGAGFAPFTFHGNSGVKILARRVRR